jgi:hypothetical protein
MKKVLLTAAAVMTFGLMNAQEETSTSAYKPTEGTIATEVSLNGGLNNANFNLNNSAVKFRYFFKEDMALRVGLGINSNKTTDVNNSNPANVRTEIITSSNNLVKLGVEKHFAGSERLSTYAGADLLVGFSSSKYDYTENNYSYTESNYTGNGGSAFGLGLFTGADYYIAKKVFLGVEAGLNFLSGKGKDNKITETGSADVTVSGGKNSGLSTTVVGGVRIGFQF